MKNIESMKCLAQELTYILRLDNDMFLLIEEKYQQRQIKRFGRLLSKHKLIALGLLKGIVSDTES